MHEKRIYKAAYYLKSRNEIYNKKLYDRPREKGCQKVVYRSENTMIDTCFGHPFSTFRC